MITIKKSSPQGNLFGVLDALRKYKRKMNRDNIQTPLIDKFITDQEWRDLDYDQNCKRVSELTHGYIKVI